MITLDAIKNNLKLNEYKNLVLEWNKKINLTSITEDNEFLEKHFYDSLCVLDEINFQNAKVIDVGTGAGFPGIPLAIFCPDSTFYLVEPIKKRCAFLEIVKEQLSLNNVVILNSRVEDLGIEYRDFFDFAVSRAVASTPILLEIETPFLKVGGEIILYKGINYRPELEDAKNAISTLSLSQKKIFEKKLLFSKEPRFYIIFTKEKETDIKYPRPFSKIKKKPL